VSVARQVKASFLRSEGMRPEDFRAGESSDSRLDVGRALIAFCTLLTGFASAKA
jgi:hypothetical protein